MFIPVVARDGVPLMPTIPSRARRWVKRGRATPFWSKGVWCIRLNDEPSGRETQPIAVGIDPGSKKEALTVASAPHAYLHIQADAVTWVQGAMTTRRQMRRARRYRHAPYRRPRANRRRNHAWLPPSTKARWQWKLRLVRWLMHLYPVTSIAVEDVRADTRKGKRRWNKSFSPLEGGKWWFYEQMRQIGRLHTWAGHEVAAERASLGLAKSHQKTAEVFRAHAVDSWTLTRLAVGGRAQPDQTRLLCIAPFQLHRRQLHRLEPSKGGVRASYGGTRSMGFARGSYVTHVRYGLCYVGGTMKGKISLHAIATGKRLTQGAHPSDCRFRAYASWRWWMPASSATAPVLPRLKSVGLLEVSL